jgi:hypothetical protein
MPKKKIQPEQPSVQIVFRVPADLHEALQTAATSLTLDMSNLLRLMITEHVAEYIKRGEQAADDLRNARSNSRPRPRAGRSALDRQQRRIDLEPKP